MGLTNGDREGRLKIMKSTIGKGAERISLLFPHHPPMPPFLKQKKVYEEIAAVPYRISSDTDMKMLLKMKLKNK